MINTLKKGIKHCPVPLACMLSNTILLFLSFSVGPGCTHVAASSFLPVRGRRVAVSLSVHVFASATEAASLTTVTTTFLPPPHTLLPLKQPLGEGKEEEEREKVWESGGGGAVDGNKN